MAVSDVTVANLPATDAPASATPAPVEKPVEIPAQPKRDFFNEEIYEPTYDHSDNQLPQDKDRASDGAILTKPTEPPDATGAIETPSTTDAAAPSAASPTAAAPKHSPDALQAAAQLGLPAAEIDQMSPAELTRTIRHMNAIAQAAWDAARQSAPTQAAQPVVEAPVEESIFSPEELAAIDPTAAEILKQKFKGVKTELSERDKKLAAMESELVAMRIERVNTRLDGLVKEIGPDAAKVMDRSTAAGDKAFRELLVTMKFVQDKGRALGQDYSEKEILQRSLREMGIAAGGAASGAKQDAAVEAALAARMAEQDAGALSQPNSRESDESDVERVRKVLQRRGLPVRAREQPTEWNDD